MHTKNFITKGKSIADAKKVLVMLHGRGANAQDILSLADHLNVKEYALVAPQATQNTWYPYSFLAPPAQNEPWLSSALSNLKDLVADLNAQGVNDENIFFAGFSQGACLTLEFITRNARRWGGAAAFTGGLIGDTLYTQNYKGDFQGTPVFIGTSDPDPHVPVERVRASMKQLESMNARVTIEIYKGMGHTVSQEEVDRANEVVFR